MTTADVTFPFHFTKADFKELVSLGKSSSAIRTFERLTKIPVTFVDANFGRVMADSIDIIIDAARIKPFAPRPSPSGSHANKTISPPMNNAKNNMQNDDHDQDEAEQESEIVTRLRKELDEANKRIDAFVKEVKEVNELKSINAAQLHQLNYYRQKDGLSPIPTYDQDLERRNGEMGGRSNSSSSSSLVERELQQAKLQLQQLQQKKQQEAAYIPAPPPPPAPPKSRVVLKYTKEHVANGRVPDNWIAALKNEIENQGRILGKPVAVTTVEADQFAAALGAIEANVASEKLVGVWYLVPVCSSGYEPKPPLNTIPLPNGVSERYLEVGRICDNVKDVPDLDVVVFSESGSVSMDREQKHYSSKKAWNSIMSFIPEQKIPPVQQQQHQHQHVVPYNDFNKVATNYNGFNSTSTSHPSSQQNTTYNPHYHYNEPKSNGSNQTAADTTAKSSFGSSYLPSFFSRAPAIPPKPKLPQVKVTLVVEPSIMAQKMVLPQWLDSAASYLKLQGQQCRSGPIDITVESVTNMTHDAYYSANPNSWQNSNSPGCITFFVVSAKLDREPFADNRNILEFGYQVSERGDCDSIGIASATDTVAGERNTKSYNAASAWSKIMEKVTAKKI